MVGLFAIFLLALHMGSCYEECVNWPLNTFQEDFRSLGSLILINCFFFCAGDRVCSGGSYSVSLVVLSFSNCSSVNLRKGTLGFLTFGLVVSRGVSVITCLFRLVFVLL